MFLTGIALFGSMILLPLYYQIARGESPLIAGLLVAPQGLGAALGMNLGGRATDRYGGGRVVVVGLLFLLAGTAIFTQVGATTSYWLIGAALVLRGIGLGGSMMPAMAAAYATLTRNQVPRATPALNVLQRVGGSIGAALLIVILQNRIISTLGEGAQGGVTGAHAVRRGARAGGRPARRGVRAHVLVRARAHGGRPHPGAPARARGGAGPAADAHGGGRREHRDALAGGPGYLGGRAPDLVACAVAATNPNELLIERFYGAFAQGDGAGMEACYAPDVHFSDAVFTDLRGGRAGAMWRMLTDTPGDLRIELLEHEAGDTSGSAHWRAHYTFTQTGRPVVNDIQASFRFKDGLIVEHRDDFSFYRWARQALGPTGQLLGWTPVVRSAVRKKAAARLDEFAGS